MTSVKSNETRIHKIHYFNNHIMKGFVMKTNHILFFAVICILVGIHPLGTGGGIALGQCVPPPSGMVAWWPGDNSTTDIVNGNNGTLMSGATYATGKVSQAFDFSNGSGYLDVPSSSTLNFGTGDFSFDAWVKLPAGQSTRTIVDKRDAATTVGYSFWFWHGLPGVNLTDGSWSNYGANPADHAPIDDDLWHHVAVTVQRSNTNGITFYIDGAPLATRRDPTTHPGSLTNSGNLRLGLNVFGQYSLGGLTDEVELFSRVLTPAEVLSIFQADSLGKCKPTVPNHFKTWRVQPYPFFTQVKVQDQFMTDSLWLSEIDYLSNPVKKMHQSQIFDIIDSLDHLTWYRAEGKPANLTVNYVNQFESTAVAIDSVRYLLLPTQKFPHNPPDSLDHYKAYQITNATGFRIPIVLEDQFDVHYGLPENIDSLVPRYFLTPAVKNMELQWLYDSVTHYVAYEIFPKRQFPQPVNTLDQFGPHSLQVIYSQYLLVPTRKQSYSPPPDTLGSIGGIKFEDLNGDGIQGLGELGLPGWWINLAGPVPSGMWTSAGGVYSFNNLPAGIYTVSEVLQPGWTQTAPAPVPPGTHVVNLLAGQDVVGKDFGNDSLGSICGHKFNDLNCNGAWDAGEPALGGWTINLGGPVPGSVVTGPDGSYCFNGLSPGVYTVSEVFQDGWTQSMPPSPGTYAVTLLSRHTVTGNDFGNCPPKEKNHYKTWRVEPGSFDIMVNVQDQFMTDSLKLTKIDFISNPTQKYHPPNNFAVIKPNDHLTWYRATGKNTSLTVIYKNQFESTAVSIGSVEYLLLPTQEQPFAPPESLDHYKAYPIINPQVINTWISLWDQFDECCTGYPEPQDSLIPRYFITPALKNNELPRLYDSVTHYVAYEFDHKLFHTMPVNTLDQFGAHLLQVRNSEYLLVPTKKLSYELYGSVCGKKYIDADGDCTYDPGETLLAGWQITLKNSGGVTIGTVTTNVQGEYCFQNLTPGLYTIGEVLMSGWQQTCPLPVPPGTYTVNLLPGQQLTGYDFANQQIPQHECPTWVNRFDKRKEGMGFKIPTDAKLMTRNLAVRDTGDIYVCGYSDGYGTKMDYVTINYDESGTELWATPYNNVPVNGNDKAYALVVDADKNTYVTGESDGGKPTRVDIATVKYNSAGVQQWAARWNNATINGRDAGYAIALNSTGTIVYVTGETYNKPNGIDYITVAHNAATGAQLWATTYNGPGSKIDKAYAITVDASGDVIVTGESYGGKTTGPDYATVKYNGLTGAQMWVARYDGPIHKKDYAFAIATDPANNVHVTGASEGLKFDYATIKYDAAGTQLWVARYDAESKNDFGYDLALDNAGNVYVTGASQVKLTSLDYATVKYNPVGTQIWVNRYDGIRKKDIGRSVTVCNEEEKVFVTGSSDQGSGRGLDFATLKIDATAGTTDWVGRYNGPVGKADIAYNVRVRPNDCCVVLTGTSTGVTGLHFATIQGASSSSVPWATTTPAIYDGYADEDVPTTFTVDQNYPNPFNPTTTIQFTLPQQAFVTLKVYNVLGQEVARLIDNELMEDGTQEAEFDAGKFSSGVYFYHFTGETVGDDEEGTPSQRFTSVKKMLLLK